MRATILEGSVEEIAEFIRVSGMTEDVPQASVVEQEGEAVNGFVREKVRGNAEKERLVRAYITGACAAGDIRFQVAFKQTGDQNDYLKGRLTSVEENRVGDVIYCRPSAASVIIRLPGERVAGFKYAKPMETKRSAAELAKVKHQVIIHLVNDEAVAEAIELTTLAIKAALSREW